MAKRKKLRPGEVWEVEYIFTEYGDEVTESDTFLAFINIDEQLVNLDESGSQWVLNEEYCALVKRIQKGEGDPFVPECLQAPPVELPELQDIKLYPVQEFDAGYYHDGNNLLWYRSALGAWRVYDRGEWVSQTDVDDEYWTISDLGLKKF